MKKPTGEHLIDGEFQSDKYPACPRGKVPLSTKDKTAQDLLWEYAQRRRVIDPEFSRDLENALKFQGYKPPNYKKRPTPESLMDAFRSAEQDLPGAVSAACKAGEISDKNGGLHEVFVEIKEEETI